MASGSAGGRHKGGSGSKAKGRRLTSFHAAMRSKLSGSSNKRIPVAGTRASRRDTTSPW